MKKGWRYGISIILFIAITFLIIIYKDFFNVNIITPTVQVLWPIIRILKVIDQKTFWGLLIVAAVILSIWLISLEKEEDYISAYNETIYLDDPILKWEGLIRRAQKKMDERIILKNKLEYLSNSIDSCLNDSINAEINLNDIKPHIWERVKKNFYFFSKISPSCSRQDSEFECQLNKILASMEMKVEIYHDDEN